MTRSTRPDVRSHARRFDRLRTLPRAFRSRFGRSIGAILHEPSSLDSIPAIIMTLGLSTIAIFVPLGRHILGWFTPYSVVWSLAGTAAVAATLLAVVFALRVFSAQYLLSRLPAPVAATMSLRQWQTAATWRLSYVLVTSLLTLGPVSASDLPYPAARAGFVNLLLLLLTIARLHRAVADLYSRGFEIRVTEATLAPIDRSFLRHIGAQGPTTSPSFAVVFVERNEPTALVEQVCMRAVQDADVATASTVLRTLAGRVAEYVSERPPNGRPVLAWFGDLLRMIGERTLPYDDRIGRLVGLLFGELIENTANLNLAWTDRIELLQSFRRLRHRALMSGARDVCDTATSVLERAFVRVLKTVPAEDAIWSLSPQTVPYSEEASAADLEWMQAYEWIHEFYADAALAIAHDRPEAFSTIQSAMHSLYYDIRELPGLGQKQRSALLWGVVSQAKQSILDALAEGRGAEFVRWRLGSTLIIGSGRDEWGETSELVLDATGEVAVASARFGALPYLVLNQLATAGRGAARNADDQRAIQILETLGALAQPLASHRTAEMELRYLQAIGALRSIRGRDKREFSDLKDTATREMARFSEEEDRLQRWRDGYPGLRRRPEPGVDDRPWA